MKAKECLIVAAYRVLLDKKTRYVPIPYDLEAEGEILLSEPEWPFMEFAFDKFKDISAMIRFILKYKKENPKLNWREDASTP